MIRSIVTAQSTIDSAPTATPPHPAPPLSLLGTIASLTCYSPQTVSYFFVLATLTPTPLNIGKAPLVFRYHPLAIFIFYVIS
jgi:hypothetical protein